MMLDSRKRPCPEWSTPSTKTARTYAFSAPSRHATGELQTAFLCIRQLQARTLERLASNGDWDTARNLLVQTEHTRRVVVQARRKALLAHPTAAQSPIAAHSAAKARKRVSFNEVMVVFEAVDMDRATDCVDEPPHPEELLLVRTMGLQATPLANFSELW